MKNAKPERLRATLFFSGRVQGVGFRFHTNEIAKKWKVAGTVENLDDGRVKIVVEGETGEIDHFIQAIAVSMCGNIKEIQRFESAASDEFVNFSVRR